MFFNSNDNQVLISTHSPYTLTAVNNLIYAHKVGLKNRNTSNIIPESLWLNINRVGAIMLSDGELHSIIDTEINEIAAEEIDKISQKISKDLLIYIIWRLKAKMSTHNKYKQWMKTLNAGERDRLKEEGAILYIKTTKPIELYKIDKG
jgi:hypothetical protein